MKGARMRVLIDEFIPAPIIAYLVAANSEAICYCTGC